MEIEAVKNMYSRFHLRNIATNKDNKLKQEFFLQDEINNRNLIER